MNVPPSETEIFPQYFPSRFVAAMPVGHGETVLVVDDEELVRNGVARSLARFNYTVLTANTGIAAVEIFRKHQHDIKLVITDIIMPDMNGAALLHVLRILEPDLKAIAISGYAPSCPAIDLLQEDQQHFLAKPFATSELLCMVRATLDEASREFRVIEGIGAPTRRRRLVAKPA
jgi:two-component system cell cycle sensor histidine kinase/response regulator CckA